MNKERYNQIIDEVYENYLNNFAAPVCPPTLDVQPDFDEPLSKETFIKLIKHSRGFSKKWGLKIEERELSLEERLDIAIKMGYDSFDLDIAMGNSEDALSDYGIPTREITLTYKNETIEVYE